MKNENSAHGYTEGSDIPPLEGKEENIEEAWKIKAMLKQDEDEGYIFNNKPCGNGCNCAEIAQQENNGELLKRGYPCLKPIDANRLKTPPSKSDKSDNDGWISESKDFYEKWALKFFALSVPYPQYIPLLKEFLKEASLKDNERLREGIKKFCHHWEIYFGSPKVGQPPAISDLLDLLSTPKPLTGEIK